MNNRNYGLFEESISHSMFLEKGGDQQYQVNRICGHLKASAEPEEIRYKAGSASNLREIDGFSEAFGGKVPDNFIESVRLVPEKVVRNHDKLFSFLENSVDLDWKVKFGTKGILRGVTKGGVTPSISSFRHFSVHVEFSYPYGRVEIGEGRIDGAKFNIDGLCNRIKGILDNYRNVKKTSLNHMMPVILNAGDGGIVFHEVLGHSLEADYVAAGDSPFSLKDINCRKFAEGITVTVKDKLDPFFSEIASDDEGNCSDLDTIVDRGVLKDFLSDSFHSEVLGIGSKGHGRTEIYSRMAIPRMYGLYIRPGSYSREEIFKSTALGIYAAEFGEGKVFFSKNRFFFRIKSAWLVEKGEITEPLGEVVVEGNISDTLNSINMVGEDFRYDRGISNCIKKGQLIHVRVGQPTVKIDNLVVRSYGY